MFQLLWTAESRSDVDDVYDNVAHRELQPALADIAVRDLLAECEMLAEQTAGGAPIGIERPDFGDGIRLHSIKRWVVFFRPIDRGVEILRVLDGSDGITQVVGD